MHQVRCVAPRWGHRARAGVDTSASRPARLDVPPAVADGRWQVFGLTGVLVTEASGRCRTGAYWPSLPGCWLHPVLCDGGRSRIPLRGSPGVSPGSLLPLPVDAVTHPHRASSRAGEDQHVHHIRGWANGATPTCCVPERLASWGGKPVPRRVRRATTQSVRPAPSFPHPALPQEGGTNHGHASAGHSVRRGRVSAAPTSATTAKPSSTDSVHHRSAPTSAWSRTAATASTA